MRNRYPLSSRFLLSTRATAVTSVILGSALYALGTHLAQGTYKPGFKFLGVEISLLSTYFSLTLTAVGLAGPWLLKLCAYLIITLMPRPGARALPAELITQLQKAFDCERERIAEATVPSHLPTAKPATSARDIDLGDANLVISKVDRDLVHRFIGSPPSSLLGPASPREVCERQILMVTGEPGGGKSVLVQEFHASLSRGVENGFHSFVPLVVFARDLTLVSLQEAERRSDRPLHAFVTAYYDFRANQPGNDGLRALYKLVNHEWERLNIVLFIDGMDEIAQRSAYNQIQHLLADMIVQDLKSGRAAVHRFVLSCRIDEDLELFRHANKLVLRGLTSDVARTRFYNAIIDQVSPNRAARESIKRALDLRRVAPDHAFRRNPYFLALLVNYLVNRQGGIREEYLDFDFLMRKYLEREVARPFRPLHENYENAERRRALFAELESIARLPLEFLAFRSASSARIAALYDETPLDEDLIRAFVREFEHRSKSTNANLWSNASALVDSLIAKQSEREGTHIGSEFLADFHENDVRLLATLAQQIVAGAPTKDLIFGAFGTIPVRRLLEEESWYQSLAADLATTIKNIDFSQRAALICLIFFRGVVAAHTLRIILLSQARGVTLRFRHRRLAEYYAACYVRDRWDLVREGLQLTPWLGPVLNLSSALVGSPCVVLEWLAQRVDDRPSQPLYLWRYNVEATVEAAFFSQPGEVYERCLASLLSKAVIALTRDESASQTNDKQIAKRSLDAVTEIILQRSIVQVGELKSTLQGIITTPSVLRDFRAYEARATPEWISEMLPAALAMDALAGTRPPISLKIRRIGKLVQDPHGLPARTLLKKGHLITVAAVLASTVTSEVISILWIAALGGTLFFTFSFLMPASDDRIVATAIIATALAIWRLLARVRLWVSSPSTSAMTAGAVWRTIARLFEWAARARSCSFAGFSRLLRRFVVAVRKHFITALRAIALAAIGVAVIVAVVYFGLGFLQTQPQSQPQPKTVNICPKVEHEANAILGRYSSLQSNLSSTQISNIRLTLRHDIDALANLNQQRCDSRLANGDLVFVEDAVVCRSTLFEGGESTVFDVVPESGSVVSLE